MWILENSQLPIVASADPNFAPIAYLETGESLAAIALIDFQANYQRPGTQQSSDPAIVNAITNGNTINIGNLIQVDAIAIGNIIYLPAIDPANPRSGEFVLSGQTATLTPLLPIRSGLPIQIIGGVETTTTDYIDPSILELFHGLPVVAEVKWSLSIENHPSGSINLRVIGDDNCKLVDAKFKKGTELTFAGIGFSVTSYSKTLENTHDAPGRLWSVSISLGGKWEAKKYQRPVFLLPSANVPVADGMPYQDPACQIYTTIQTLRKARPLRISVSELADRSGVKFIGFSSSGTQAEIFDRAGLKPFPKIPQRAFQIPIPLAKPLDIWSVPIPQDSPRGATGQWQQTMDSLKRHNGCFIDYTRPDAVRARDIESGDRWAYTVPALSIAYKGDCTYSPDERGYAVEYAATKLTGEFSDPSGGVDQGKSSAAAYWKHRDAKIKTVNSGNPNPIDPPETFQVIRNMGMNWDTSGPTLEAVTITTHDGVELHKVRTVYGAAFNSSQVCQDLSAGDTTGGIKHGPVQALASSFWQIVQQETTETFCDPDTRYITGSKTTGFKLGRYKTETDALELLQYEGTDEQSTYEASLYRFKKFPIYAVEQKQLVQFGSHYQDVLREPIPTELIKKCLPDGTSAMVPVRDPNFVEPMFEQASLSYKNGFSHTRNPESSPDSPLPDLTQGEEQLSERAIAILPSKSTSTIAFGNLDKFKKIGTDDDQYIQYDYEIGSQGANFGEYVAKRTFNVNSGRPGAAQQLPNTYEKEEPEPTAGNPNIYKNPQEAEYEYILCTPGHNANEPSTSSIGYSNASYLYQGLVGAQTDLKFKDIQESIEYSCTIPTNFVLRPFDYVQLNDGVTVHSARATSIENSILIQGQIGGYPLLVAPQNTQIRGGIDRTIPIAITRRSTPKAYDVFGGSRVSGLTIGQIIPPNLQGRGNY